MTKNGLFSLKKVMIKFSNAEGEEIERVLDVYESATTEDLNQFLNHFLPKKDEGSDDVPYTFYFKNYEIRKNIHEIFVNFKDVTTEAVLPIIYRPESLFMVEPINRISSSLEGHTGSILSVAFSPTGKYLASGSGDKSTSSPSHRHR